MIASRSLVNYGNLKPFQAVLMDVSVHDKQPLAAAEKANLLDKSSTGPHALRRHL